MASRPWAAAPTPTAPAREAAEYRLLVAAVFAGCLPGATLRWARHRAGGPRSTPFALALEAARTTVAQAYSLPG